MTTGQHTGDLISQGERTGNVTRRGLLLGLAGAVALAGCSTVEAVPPKTTPTATPDKPQPTSPAPSAIETKTAQPEKVEVPPFREWKLAPDTAKQLEQAQSPTEQWNILKKIIKDNNKPGSYELDMPLNSTRPPKDLANRAMIELATMADIGIDPNVPGGDKISNTWAELAIIDPETRGYFNNEIFVTRKYISGNDPQSVKEEIVYHNESPAYHTNGILIISDSVQHFHDPKTSTDYAGVTFTTVSKLNVGNPSVGDIDTFTIVFDSANNATQILRRYGESDPQTNGKGWMISYNVGEEPQQVRDIPEVRKVIAGSDK